MATRAEAAGERGAGGGRQESLAFRWEELTEEQRTVARSVHAVVAALAARAPAPRKHDRRDMLRLDPDKRNQVILIEGRRGSGKTSVMLHLFDGWNRRWLGEPEAPRQVAAAEEPPLTFDDGVIPLRLVDLHPIPEGTHLLLHIVQSLFHAIPRSEDDECPKDDDGFRERRVTESESQWEKLLRALVTGWDDGFLRARRGTLDPEAYVEEIRESEAELSSLSHCFREFVDVLCKDVKRAHGFPRDQRLPMFVIGIDDADMTARRVNELLEVLQLLVHPRVAFVLTGARELFEIVAQKHVVGTVFRPTSGLTVPQRGSDEVDLEYLGGLTRDLLDKVIPPSQRFKIGDVSAAQRWPFLRGMMSEVAGAEGRGLPRDRLLLAIEPVVEAQPDFGTILPERLRELRDLAGALSRSATTSEWFAALAPIEPSDGRSGHEPLAVVSSVGGPDGPELDIRMTRSHAVVLAPTSPIHASDTLITWAHLGFDTTEAGGAQGPRSPLLGRWLRLAARLAAAGSRWSGMRSTINAYDLPIVVGQWRRQDGARFAFPWPLPTGMSAAALATFDKHWPRSWQPEPGRTVEGLVARGFLSAVLSTFGGEDLATGEMTTAKLVAAIVALWRKESARDAEAYSSWVVFRLGLIAAPESGLSASRAGRVLSALRAAFGSGWPSVARALRSARIERARRALETSNDGAAGGEAGTRKRGLEDARDVLKRIDDSAANDHPWLTHVEGLVSRWSTALSVAGLRESGRLLEAIDDAVADFDPLLSKMAQFESTTGASPRARRVLWEEACALCRRPDLKEVFDRSTDQVVRPTPVDTKFVTLGCASLSTFFAEIELRGQTASTRWLRELLKILWDERVNRGQIDLSLEPSWFPHWSEAAYGTVPNAPKPLQGLQFGWPALRWPTFASAARFAEWWNWAFPRVAALDAITPEQRDMVAVMSWVTRIYESVYTNRGYPLETEINLDLPEDCSGRIAAVTDQLKKLADSARQRNYFAARAEAWLSRIPLLAMPESGLRGEVAEAIWKACEKLELTSADRLRQFRLERLEAAGADPTPENLEALDAAVCDYDEWHWYRDLSPKRSAP